MVINWYWNSTFIKFDSKHFSFLICVKLSYSVTWPWSTSNSTYNAGKMCCCSRHFLLLVNFLYRMWFYLCTDYFLMYNDVIHLQWIFICYCLIFLQNADYLIKIKRGLKSNVITFSMTFHMFPIYNVAMAIFYIQNFS